MNEDDWTIGGRKNECICVKIDLKRWSFIIDRFWTSKVMSRKWRERQHQEYNKGRKRGLTIAICFFSLSSTLRYHLINGRWRQIFIFKLGFLSLKRILVEIFFIEPLKYLEVEPFVFLLLFCLSQESLFIEEKRRIFFLYLFFSFPLKPQRRILFLNWRLL